MTKKIQNTTEDLTSEETSQAYGVVKPIMFFLQNFLIGLIYSTKIDGLSTAQCMSF
jgi:hypothetical protein